MRKSSHIIRNIGMLKENTKKDLQRYEIYNESSDTG